jgi:hypothetical protein
MLCGRFGGFLSYRMSAGLITTIHASNLTFSDKGELGLTYGVLSINVTVSAISATLFAILAAIISKGDTPFMAAGTGGVFFAATAVAVRRPPAFLGSAPAVRGRLAAGRDEVWLAAAVAIVNTD